MKKKIISFKDSTITGFADDVDLSGFEVTSYQKTRVSRILPLNLFLRIAFLIIRTFSFDNSKIANWTRYWQCLWIVRIKNETYGPFKYRSDAIAFEKEHLISMNVLLD